LRKASIVCFLLLAVGFVVQSSTIVSVQTLTDPMRDLFDRQGRSVTGEAYLDIIEIELTQSGDEYSVRAKMNGPLPLGLSDPAIFIEWDLLVDIDQTPGTSPWSPTGFPLMDNGIGVDALIRLMLGPSGQGYRAEVRDLTLNRRMTIGFRIDGNSIELKVNASVSAPKAFDCVFVVRKFGEYGRSGAEIACDKAPDQGYCTYSDGKTSLRALSTTAQERLKNAAEMMSLINRYLRDSATGAYYTEAQRDWTRPSPPTLYAQARAITALLELYLAKKEQIYLTYAKDAWNFMETKLKSAGGAYGWTTTDSMIDLFVNAQAVLALIRVYEVTGDDEAIRRAREVADFLVSSMSDKVNGGFCNVILANGTRGAFATTWYQATTVLSLAKLYTISKNPVHLEYAERTQNLLDKYMWTDGLGYWSYPASDWSRRLVATEAFDGFRQAWAIRALIALHLATGKPEYLEKAKRTAAAVESFWNTGPASGYDMFHANGTRFIPPRNIAYSYDVEALVELAKTTREDIYLKQARRVIDLYTQALSDRTYGGLYVEWSVDGRRLSSTKSTTAISKWIESILLYGYEVLIISTGLPKAMKTRVFIDGTEFGSLQDESSRLVTFKLGTSHEIKLDEMVQVFETTRYKCSANMKPIASEGRLSFEYKPQYFLSVKSEQGTSSGEGWYDAGSVVTISITPTSVGFGVQQVFKGWSGDSTATTPTATIEMTGPKKAVAIWSPDYTQAILVGVLALAIVGVAVFVFTQRRKTTAAPQER